MIDVKTLLATSPDRLEPASFGLSGISGFLILHLAGENDCRGRARTKMKRGNVGDEGFGDGNYKGECYGMRS